VRSSISILYPPIKVATCIAPGFGPSAPLFPVPRYLPLCSWSASFFQCGVRPLPIMAVFCLSALAPHVSLATSCKARFVRPPRLCCIYPLLRPDQNLCIFSPKVRVPPILRCFPPCPPPHAAGPPQWAPVWCHSPFPLIIPASLSHKPFKFPMPPAE